MQQGLVSVQQVIQGHTGRDRKIDAGLADHFREGLAAVAVAAVAAAKIASFGEGSDEA